ncbi:enterobactin transporter EntS [Rhodococcus sp. NPDC060090]|uniref:enterobactin transporter EntS n=1 Tax=Rhodococcus sp. NPDC060090 TaxID=3347056 RepID=UPI00364EA686
MSGRGLLVDLSPLRESPPFRSIVIARTIAVFGIGMLIVAVPVQIFDLTGSTAHVGFASTSTGIATLFGLLAGGVLADRFDRRRLIVWTRAICGLTFVGLALNAASADPSVWAIYVLGAIDGAIGAVSITALLAVTPALIPKNSFAAAGAINALTVQLGMMASPALGGVLIASAGVTWNYWAAAAGTLLTVPLLMTLPALKPDEAETESPWASLAGGFRFALGHTTVRSVLIVGTIALLGGGVGVLIPAFVEQRFGGDPRAAGLLYSATAVGAALGSVGSGWIKGMRRKGYTLTVALTISFIALAGVGFAPAVWIALVLLAVAGAFSATQEIVAYTLIQTNTPDRLLGRTNSLWSAQNVFGLAVGSAVAGIIGSFFVASTALIVYGAIMVTLSLLALLTLRSLRDYVDHTVHAVEVDTTTQFVGAEPDESEELR